MKQNNKIQTFKHANREPTIFVFVLTLIVMILHVSQLLSEFTYFVLILLGLNSLLLAWILHSLLKEFAQITLTNKSIQWQTLFGWRKEMLYQDVVDVRQTAVNNLELIGHDKTILIDNKLLGYEKLYHTLCQKIPCLAQQDSKPLFILQTDLAKLYLKLSGISALTLLGAFLYPFGYFTAVPFLIFVLIPYLKRPINYTFTPDTITAIWLSRHTRIWSTQNLQRIIRTGHLKKGGHDKPDVDTRQIAIEWQKPKPIVLKTNDLKQYNVSFKRVLTKLHQLYPYTNPTYINAQQRLHQRQEAQLLLKEAEALQQKGKLKAALSTYEKALSLASENSHYKFVMGDLLFELNRYREASLTYRQAFAALPNHQEHWDRWGISLLHTGENQQASQAFDYAIQANSQNALAYYYGAIAYANLGQKQKAEAYKKQALDIQPDLLTLIEKTPSLPGELAITP